MRPDLIKRINELANKDKKEGLTGQEKAERERLRKEYLDIFRDRFRGELENIKIVDEKDMN
jgi:uncharacterized protein YnzC (UPF0291/DUF896 family)